MKDNCHQYVSAHSAKSSLRHSHAKWGPSWATNWSFHSLIYPSFFWKTLRSIPGIRLKLATKLLKNVLVPGHLPRNPNNVCHTSHFYVNNIHVVCLILLRAFHKILLWYTRLTIRMFDFHSPWLQWIFTVCVQNRLHVLTMSSNTTNILPESPVTCTSAPPICTQIDIT